MNAPMHMSWCSPDRCTDAEHRSAHAVVTTGRRRVPRAVILLASPLVGHPIKLRLIIEADVVVCSSEWDLDSAQLIASHIESLVASTRPAQ